MMEIFIGIIILVLGMCVGSFLNMAIFRLAKNYGLIFKQFPKNKSQKINEDRSYCDFCGRQLKWYENVPVISWIIQGGETKCCGKKLPIQYPLLELSVGIIFLVTSLQLRVTSYWEIINLLIYLVIASLLIFNLVFDLKYMILPDFINYSLIGLSIILLVIKGGHIGPPVQNVIVGFGALLFFFILNRIKIRGSEAMGMGDVKYSLFMGLFLGWPNILVAIYFAFVVGAITSLILLSFKLIKKEKPIPFGPFLIIGTVVAKIWGTQLIKYFFGVI